MPALDLHGHAEFGELADDWFGRPVIIDAMEGRIEGGAENALALEHTRRPKVRVEIDNGDAFEFAFAVRDGVKHAGIVAAVT